VGPRTSRSRVDTGCRAISLEAVWPDGSSRAATTRTSSWLAVSANTREVNDTCALSLMRLGVSDDAGCEHQQVGALRDPKGVVATDSNLP
jgi:hypothetical protein